MLNVTVDKASQARLLAAIADLKDSKFRKWMRTGVTKASRRIAATAKQLAPQETGSLKRSIGSKVVTYDSGTVVGIIGAQRGVTKMDKSAGKCRKFGVAYAVRMGKHGMRRMTKREILAAAASGQRIARRRPSAYSHLVEFGHRVANRGTLVQKSGKARTSRIRGMTGKGRHLGFVPASPAGGWLRPATTQNSAAVQDLIADAVRQGIMTEVSRG